MPASAQSVSVIAHVSDVHFGAHVAELVESLIADMRDHHPDLIVVSGDLTQRARPNQFEQARAFLARMPGPVLTVMGNHDVPLLNMARRVLSPTQRYRESVTPILDPAIVLPGLVAVGLDTMPAWRWKAGHVSARQANLVRNTLGKSPQGAWRVVVTHHPVLPAKLSGLRGRRRLIAACDDAGVALLLSGHTHRASVDVVALGDDGLHGHALAVVAGTTTSSRIRRTTNAYNVIELSGEMRDGATVTVLRRESKDSGWTQACSSRFAYRSNGIVPFKD
jgi:3',5'-cyclic AMP phosphodiesterase CpdA